MKNILNKRRIIVNDVNIVSYSQIPKFPYTMDECQNSAINSRRLTGKRARIFMEKRIESEKSEEKFNVSINFYRSELRKSINKRKIELKLNSDKYNALQEKYDIRVKKFNKLAGKYNTILREVKSLRKYKPKSIVDLFGSFKLGK